MSGHIARLVTSTASLFSILSARITIASVVLALAGALAFYINSLRVTIADLEKENVVLTTNNNTLKESNKTLKQNVATLTEANENNLKTIRALVDEREAAKKAIISLSAKTKKNEIELDKLQREIDEMLKIPSNDGPVAPVLLETVKQIQETRRNQ